MSVEGWEMYVKIDITDTGIGISEQHQGTIFKRFYREDAVHDVDGIGIGLYLAREIVTLQGGISGWHLSWERLNLFCFPAPKVAPTRPQN